MAQIAASTYRAAVTYAVSQASAGALRTWLAAKVASTFGDVSSGRSVASVSMNGVSTSFFDPASAGMSQQDAVQMWQRLLELCDTCITYLDDDEATNAEIAAEMTGRLPDVYQHSVEFAGMNQW